MHIKISVLALFCFATILVGISCSKDNKEEPTEDINTPVDLNINGENIIFMAAAAKMPVPIENKEYYNLWLDYHTSNNFLRKVLIVQVVKPEPGYKRLYKFDDFASLNMVSSFYTFLSDGDVAGNLYYLNEDDSIADYLEITRFDTINRVVEGKFQASYYVAPDEKLDPSSPDSLVVRSDYFQMKIAK